MKENKENLKSLLERIEKHLNSEHPVVVKIEKGSNGRIFTEITPTEKIIIKI